MAAMKLTPLVISAFVSWVLLMAAPAAGYGISGGLDGGEVGGTAQCWEALVELKTCTNEIILFFFNGEAYLGKECCRSIRVIIYHCWPNMLTSIGYTAEEADVLRDYCGAPAPVPSV